MNFESMEDETRPSSTMKPMQNIRMDSIQHATLADFMAGFVRGAGAQQVPREALPSEAASPNSTTGEVVYRKNVQKSCAKIGRHRV